MRGAIPLTLALILTGCGGEEPKPSPTPTASPKPTPLPSPADVPGALPAPELQGARTANGGWRKTEAGVVFGPEGKPFLTIDCDRERRVLGITRGGVQGTRLRIVIDLAAATLNASEVPGGTRAETNRADPFVRALAEARGAIGVQVDDGMVLAVPADATLREAVADCRRPY